MPGAAGRGGAGGHGSLVRRDLEERPELTPWLASVYVVPEFRRRGHAGRLVRAVERAAAETGTQRLYLYTLGTAPLYASLGWSVLGPGRDRGKPVTIMCRDLGPG